MLADELNSTESRRLLKIVDDTREILHHEKINLPHIVVVGDQSVGKSSVLEALSGVQLPRAQNICTRCPLELRMKSIPSNVTEYATIRCEGVAEIRINNFSKIMTKVAELTVKLAGATFNVSSLPIYLTVYKKDTPVDLTLIDLPGITRNPIAGQSKTIHKDIVDLIENYIKPETAIVLHVIPASVDFTTSESIQISKKYDPNGKRQLIAVSKIDKYDQGIGGKLQGIGSGSIELELGCVAVLNRSQEEIDQNISFDEMRKREATFFSTQKAFENVPERCMGSGQLVKRLASIQQERIRSTLPLIIDELKKQIKDKKLELKQMPPPVSSEMDCWILYTNLVRKYREIVHARVNAVYNNDLQIQTEATLTGEHFPVQNILPVLTVNNRCDDRIAFQLHVQQKRCAETIHDLFAHFFTQKYQNMVLNLIEENAGVALPNFPSFSIIERLYRAEQKKFTKPCEELVKHSVDYLKQTLIQILDDVFDEETSYKYKMIHKLTDIIMRSIEENEEKCDNDVTKMLEIEQRVFTLNQYYMDTVNKTKEKIQKYNDDLQNGMCEMNNVPSRLTVNDFVVDMRELSNEHQAAFEVQVAISSYCRVVEKRIIDQVAQLCYYWLITQCALILDFKLSSAFTSANLFEWMREPVDQQQKRDNLKKSIDAMKRALVTGQNA